MKLEAVSFRDYARRSIPVSLLAESIYCEAKVSNRHELGEIETPILLEGRRLHEQDAKKALRKFGPTKKAKVVTLEDALLLSYTNVALALRKRRMIANSEKKKRFISIIPDHGILGFPDFVDCKDGKSPIIIEQKNCKRIPTSPWPDHQIQVVAYSMSLEVLGFNPQSSSECSRTLPWDGLLKRNAKRKSTGRVGSWLSRPLRMLVSIFH